MINGTNLRVFIAGESLQSEQSNTLTFTNDLPGATLGVTNSYDEVITGRKGATISFSGLYSFLGTELEVGDNIQVHFGVRDGGWVADEAIVESISIDTQSDTVMTMSGNIAVTGELRKFVPEIVECPIATRDNCNILTIDDCEILARVQDN